MGTIVSDLRYAVRSLKTHVGTTVVMVLTLALGIGVNASSFVMVNALVLHPLPYPQLERVVTLWEAPARSQAQRRAVAPANFLDWTQQSQSFEAIAAYRPWSANLTGTDDAVRVLACRVTLDYFKVLGMKPARGRTFGREEMEREHAKVVVVSQGFWKRTLAAAADLSTRTIQLDGETFQVVGVMPEDFNFPLETDIWVPLTFTPAERNERNSRSLAAIARLRAGVSLQQARTETAAIAHRISELHRSTNESLTAVVIPILELTNNVTDRFTVMLLATAGFVLLLAAANVANLMLVRSSGRWREIAVRTALGATRWRIVRQLSIESFLIALLACALGCLLASWENAAMRSAIPAWVLTVVAGMKNAEIDGTVVLFTIALSILAAALCTIPAAVNAMRASGADLAESLREGGRGSSAGLSRRRLQFILATAEVLFALVLMVGAGVMVQTFQRLFAVDLGYNTKGLLTLQLALPPNRYSGPPQVSGFYDRVLGGIATVPGSTAVALASELARADALYIEGRPDPRAGELRPQVKAVSAGYFETLQIPVMKGRAFSRQDSKDTAPVVVISDTVARQYWPESDPLGVRVKLRKTDREWLRVVGVTGDVRDWFQGTPEPAVYVLFAQHPQLRAGIFVRSESDPMQLSNAVRSEIRAVDRAQPVFDVKTVDQQIAEETSGVRISAVTMSMYALIALVLAATGIYAIISYSVSQRVHEIGVRMTLGADTKEIVRMVMAETIRIGAGGLLIGIPAVVILMKIMSSVLYGVVRLEWMTLAVAVLVLVLSAALAGYIPATRATRIDPASALREE